MYPSKSYSLDQEPIAFLLLCFYSPWNKFLYLEMLSQEAYKNFKLFCCKALIYTSLSLI